jgi:hypothetical protein
MTASLSPRRRRLRWTIALLILVLVLGGLTGAVIYQRSRPVVYRPDERPDDITSELARSLPTAAPRPRLAEVTREAGLADFRNFAGTRTSQLPEDMGPGLAWGDYDNDGDDDIFLVSVGGSLALSDDQLLPCVLFENRGDGTFEPASGFPEVRIRGLGAAWGDYDGDGFLDLVVTGHDALRLFHNEGGTGRFTADPRLPEPGGFWSGAAWGDYDNDRCLDLYVCNYVDYSASERDHDMLSDQLGTAVPFTLNPSSFPPGRNALFRRQPDGSFRNMAAELRVENPEGRSLGGLWHDFDQDGWLDLYVANDVSDNVFFRNVGGRFEDISHAAWAADYRSAMGLAAGDIDRDGDDDLLITHWVAQENALYENLWADFRGGTGATMGPGAALAAGPAVPAAFGLAAGAATNRPPAVRFMDVADQRGLGQIALPFVGWGTEFVDLDQDGWLDLLAANGSTLETDAAPPRLLQPQEAFVFWNERGRHFHNLAPLHTGLSGKHVSRGLACADYDLDGDQDFVIADLYEGVRLYRNDMSSGNWLKIRLRSRNAQGQPVGFGEGSTVTAWFSDTALRRSVTGVSYLSQSSRTLHWGLGSSERIDRLEVRWLGGATNHFEGLAANACYEIVEDDPAPRRQLPHPSVTARPSPGPATSFSSAGTGDGDKQRLLLFWNTQRAAMNAMKVDRDNARAIQLFRDCIALNPKHEDSRYYLGLCLASEGDAAGALVALAELQQLNPQSHRAWQQWGVVRALFAASDADLAQAEEALLRAHAVNPEETGALLVLGEIALLRGNRVLAADRLAAATHTNPRAVGGFFLQGYLAWKRDDVEAAGRFLERARAALGPDWQPTGATSEGDVKQKQHVEQSPLNRFWESWDGTSEPATVFRALDSRLASAPAVMDHPR